MPSKLGVLYLMDSVESQGMYDLADSGLLPIIKTGPETASRAWRTIQHTPDVIWVLSGGGQLDWKKESPKAAADRRYPEIVKNFEKVPEAWRPRVDFLELTPCMWEPKSPEQGAWYSEYLVELLPRIAGLGPRPIVLNSGVGGLPVEGKVLEPMVPGLRLAHHLGGAWGCHGYTIQYTMDENNESWYSLRYRRAYDWFSEHHPELMDLSMILLEGGVDDKGDPDKDGWLFRGSLDDYTDWLTWYDGELKKDDYVLGVTLFKIGAPTTWKSFELEPVVPWLLDHYRAARKTAAGSPGTGKKGKSDDSSGDYVRWR
jgi:hypothetical protein